LDEFLDKGVSLSVEDLDDFIDQRVLVLYSGDESVDTAINLTEVTERVILLTPDDTLVLNPDLAERLANSSVKVLYQSRLLEVRGEFEVEKVLIKNLDEDEEYEEDDGEDEDEEDEWEEVDDEDEEDDEDADEDEEDEDWDDEDEDWDDEDWEEEEEDDED